MDMGDDDDDDHDKDGIPPEILELIRMTEAMHTRATGGMGGPFGAARGPRQLRISKGSDKKDEEEDNTPRHEESHADIMAKMNKLSEEIGERHDKDKLTKLKEKKSQRYTQVLAGIGVLLLVMLVSFVLSCRAKKGSDSEVEDESGHTMKTPTGNRRMNKGD